MAQRSITNVEPTSSTAASLKATRPQASAILHTDTAGRRASSTSSAAAASPHGLATFSASSAS